MTRAPRILLFLAFAVLISAGQDKPKPQDPSGGRGKEEPQQDPELRLRAAIDEIREAWGAIETVTGKIRIETQTFEGNSRTKILEGTLFINAKAKRITVIGSVGEPEVKAVQKDGKADWQMTVKEQDKVRSVYKESTLIEVSDVTKKGRRIDVTRVPSFFPEVYLRDHVLNDDLLRKFTLKLSVDPQGRDPNAKVELDPTITKDDLEFADRVVETEQEEIDPVTGYPKLGPDGKPIKKKVKMSRKILDEWEARAAKSRPNSQEAKPPEFPLFYSFLLTPKNTRRTEISQLLVSIGARPNVVAFYMDMSSFPTKVVRVTVSEVKVNAKDAKEPEFKEADYELSEVPEPGK